MTVVAVVLIVAMLVLPIRCALKNQQQQQQSQRVSSQWLRTETDDCVGIDAHVRNDTVFIMVAGECKLCASSQAAAKTRCYFDSWANPAAPSLTRSPESRVGKQPLMYGRKPSVPLEHVLLLGCRLPSMPEASGQLRVALPDGEPWLVDINWRMPPLVALAKRIPLVLCSRLFARRGDWSARETATLVDWLEWHAAQGAFVHLYVYRIDVDVLWTILEAYERRGVVRLHLWPAEQTVLERLWAHGQVAYYADCLLRYETQARYVAFVDIDEFFVPRAAANIVELLDARFALQPQRPVVQLVRSFFVPQTACQPASCDEQRVPLVARRCLRAKLFSPRHEKYIVRIDDKRPVRLFPRIHRAIDIFGEQPELITAGVMRLLHLRNGKLPRDRNLRMDLVNLQWDTCERMEKMRESIDKTIKLYAPLLDEIPPDQSDATSETQTRSSQSESL